MKNVLWSISLMKCLITVESFWDLANFTIDTYLTYEDQPSNFKILKVTLASKNCESSLTDFGQLVIKISYTPIEINAPRISWWPKKRVNPQILYDKHDRFRIAATRSPDCIFKVYMLLHPTDNEKMLFIIYTPNLSGRSILRAYFLMTAFEVNPILSWSTTHTRPFIQQTLRCFIPRDLVSLETWKTINLVVTNFEDVKNTRTTMQGPETVMSFSDNVPDFSASCMNQEKVIQEVKFQGFNPKSEDEGNSKKLYLLITEMALLILLYLIGFYRLIIDNVLLRKSRMLQFQMIRCELTRLQLKEEMENR